MKSSRSRNSASTAASDSTKSSAPPLDGKDEGYVASIIRSVSDNIVVKVGQVAVHLATPAASCVVAVSVLSPIMFTSPSWVTTTN